MLPLALCGLWTGFGVPTVFYNLNDPRMIAYFSHDDIYMLDTIWFLYSGQFNPETVQGLRDYGLLFQYLIDLFRLVVEPVTEVTPGMLWGTVRSIYLISSLLTILALWRLASRHFESRVVPIVGVLGLALCPSFVWHMDFCKPEPVLMLLMVVGLDQILTIVETGQLKNVAIASACAVAGFVIKGFGVFLVPVIVAAVVLHWWGRKDRFNPTTWEPNWDLCRKLTPILGLAIGTGLLVVTWWVVFVRVRSISGMTLAAEYGLPQGLLAMTSAGRPIVPLILGIGILTAAIWWILSGGLPRRFVASSRVGIFGGQIFSASVLVMFFLSGLFFVLGFRWILDPADLVSKFSEASGGNSLFAQAHPLSEPFDYLQAVFLNAGEFIYTASGLRILLNWYGNPDVDEVQIASDVFTPFGLILLIWYCFMGWHNWRYRWNHGELAILKNLALGMFFTVATLYFVLTSSYSTRHMHHLMLLVPAGFLLIGQIPSFIRATGRNRKIAKFVFVILLGITFILNGQMALRWRINKLQQSDGSGDLVWGVKDWWLANVPPETPIVADLPWKSYLPPQFQKVSYFDSRGLQGDDYSRVISSLDEKVRVRNPRFIAYNAGSRGGVALPPADVLLPELDLRLKASFEGTYYTRLRYTGDRFVVYEVVAKEPE
jgi:hypothetical protein